MQSPLPHETGRYAIIIRSIVSRDPEALVNGTGWRAQWAIVKEAGLRFWSDDAFGLAGNIAFRALLALFPFLIFTSSLTAFIGDQSMVEALIDFVIGIAPRDLVAPIISEVKQIMTVQRGDALSMGMLITVWFAIGGVDSVRVGLNRAYGARETRSTLTLLAMQAAVVIVASFAFVLVVYILILEPRISSTLHAGVTEFSQMNLKGELIRYSMIIMVLMVALFVAHIWLPARSPSFVNIWPGVFLTLTFWTLLALAFSCYLRSFAGYTTYYAGLSSIAAALYFLYLSALVLIFGGEFNRAVSIRRLAREALE